jgi:hypothetical protein
MIRIVNWIRRWFTRAVAILAQEGGFARYGFPDLLVEFDNASAAPIDMSTYVDTIGGQSKEAVLEEITAAGDADERWAAVGLNRHGEITLGGKYDDTAATGPEVIFNAPGNTTTRTLKFTYGGTKTFEIECIIKSFAVGMSQGELDTYEVVLRPTGAATET